MFEEIISFIRATTNHPDGPVPLHAPLLGDTEKRYCAEAIDSSFVSSIGPFVDRFEKDICTFTGAPYSVATVSGTAALHTALLSSGVRAGEEVITQALSFVATANAISYCNADHVFVDCEKETLGMSVDALKQFLYENCDPSPSGLFNRTSGKRIAAVVPVHVFGHPVRLDKIAALCTEFDIPLTEDCAESIGSYYKGFHTGTQSLCGVFSFNGNKTITCGGGGMIITHNKDLAQRARHLSTTARIATRWEIDHDEIGYNYRMPNINAALGCAQLESLPHILKDKQHLAERYHAFFNKRGIPFFSEPENSISNYWLNSIMLPDTSIRTAFLQETHDAHIQTRPLWKPLPTLPMYTRCFNDSYPVAQELAGRMVSLPSSARPLTEKS